MSSLSSTGEFAGAGSSDLQSSRVFIQPQSEAENGIVVKAPSSTWGTGVPYGSGQALMLLKKTASPSDFGYTGILPDDLLVMRVAQDGAIGTTSNLHVATGLRQSSSYASSWAVQVQPHIDTEHIQLLEVAGQTHNPLTVYDSTGPARFRIKPNGNIEAGLTVLTGKGAVVGDVGAGGSNFFGVAHIDCQTAAKYALLQDGNGITFVNSASGQELSLRNNNTSVIRIGGAASQQLGFYGTAPTAKPTVSGAKGANAALGSLVTALSSLGLVTDSTSA